MREAINDNELELVAGGEVCFSKGLNRVSFSTLREGYEIKGSYDDARSLAISLFAQNPDMSEEGFDRLVKEAMLAQGMI